MDEIGLSCNSKEHTLRNYIYTNRNNESNILGVKILVK